MAYFRSQLFNTQTVSSQTNSEHKRGRGSCLFGSWSFWGPRGEETLSFCSRSLTFTFEIKASYSYYLGFNCVHNRSSCCPAWLQNRCQNTSAESRPGAEPSRGSLDQQGPCGAASCSHLKELSTRTSKGITVPHQWNLLHQLLSLFSCQKKMVLTVWMSSILATWQSLVNSVTAKYFLRRSNSNFPSAVVWGKHFVFQVPKQTRNSQLRFS